MATSERSSADWLLAHAEELVLYDWADPVVSRLGHDVHGPYCELFWLPLIGPSALWMLRRMARRVRAGDGAAVTVPLSVLAAEVGLSSEVSRGSRAVKTFLRLEQFAMVERHGLGVRVRCTVPPVPARLVERLPATVQPLHAQVLAARSRPTAA